MNKFLMILFGCCVWAGSVAAPLGDGAEVPTFGAGERVPLPFPPARKQIITFGSGKDGERGSIPRIPSVVTNNPAFRLRREAAPAAPAAPAVAAPRAPALPPPPSEPYPYADGVAGAGSSGHASDTSTSVSEGESGARKPVRGRKTYRPLNLTLPVAGSVTAEDIKALHKSFAAKVHRNNELGLKTGYSAKKSWLGAGAPKLGKDDKAALDFEVRRFANPAKTSARGSFYGGALPSREHEYAYLTDLISKMDNAYAKRAAPRDHAKARGASRASGSRKK